MAGPVDGDTAAVVRTVDAMDEAMLEIGWVPEGFVIADPLGLHIFESVAHRIVLGSAEPPDPPVWRCWARKALYLAPPTLDTPKGRFHRTIDLTWYVRESLGPTADMLFAGLNEYRQYPSADGAGIIYVKADHGLYLDDTYLVQVSFREKTPENYIRHMLTSVRIT